ncbi:MAG: hypothetical protein AAFO69_09935 [Bacteroidota bacterium]
MIRKKIWRYWILSIALQVMTIQWMMAQNTLQVVTRTVARQIPYQAGDSLHLKAEKANVRISAWDKEYISLTLKLISKHNKLEVAKAELDFLQFEITKSGVTHQISNYFKSDEGFKKVKGILLSEYELKVPETLLIDLKSQYGRATIKGMKTVVSTDTRFVELEVEDCRAGQDIEAYFGKVGIINTQGRANIRLQRSDFSLTAHEGSADITSSYGSVKIRSLQLTRLNMKGNKTAVEVFANSLKDYFYDFHAIYDRVVTPLGVLRGVDDSRFQSENIGKAPEMIIETTYRSIELNLQKNVANK